MVFNDLFGISSFLLEMFTFCLRFVSFVMYISAWCQETLLIQFSAGFSGTIYDGITFSFA